jgi:hypothetical protein
MKLLIVTCIKEHCSIVTSLLGQAQINIFSETDTTGRKNGQPINLSDNWFGKAGERYDSSVFFSFIEDDKAVLAMSLVNKQKGEMQADFPIHAFILPVDDFSI